MKPKVWLVTKMFETLESREMHVKGVFEKIQFIGLDTFEYIKLDAGEMTEKGMGVGLDR